jgi:hypothetical protein
MAQQVEPGAAVHGTFDDLEPVDRFRQVSRQLAGGRVIIVQEHLRSGEMKNAVPALLFGDND